jgi:hypothetical protein
VPIRPYLPVKRSIPKLSEMSKAAQSVCAANIVRLPELSADPTGGIIASIAGLAMSNTSSRRETATIRQKHKRVLALCGSESYVHAGIVVPNIEVGFDRLLHVWPRCNVEMHIIVIAQRLECKGGHLERLGPAWRRCASSRDRMIQIAVLVESSSTHISRPRQAVCGKP